VIWLGTWNAIKINISSRERTQRMMPWKLVEFIWRRKHGNNQWRGMINCLGEIGVFNVNDDGDGVGRRNLLTEVIEINEDDE
jgi:hypothetical protein